MIIVGDPGSSGGIGVLYDNNHLDLYKMPSTEGDVVNMFEKITTSNNISADEKAVCYLEKVGGYIPGRPTVKTCSQCGKKTVEQTGQPGSRMFTFGEGYGFLKGVIMSRKIPLHLVRPQDWIKVLGLGKKGGLTTTQWKNKLKAKAQMLFPEVKVTLAISDALLILEYAKRIRNSKF